MSSPKFKRFAGFHRVLHWLVALPYIALLVSGALILLQHLGWLITTTPWEHRLASLHRWIGVSFAAIVFQLLFAALVGGYWRSVGRDFFDWLMIRPRDLLWLICVPLNAFFPKWVSLPPTGRFNAGQKLHGIYILFAVIGFIVTGLIMILIPGWLTIWRIHVLLFIGALAFLCVHLFLGLINPSTRRALSGMFTGHVPQGYISEHHPLVLDEPAAAHAPHAIVSIKAVILVLIPLAAVSFLWWQGPGHAAVRYTMAGSWKTAVISPGPLVSVHSDHIRGDNCVACHTQSGPVTKSACLACHGEIRTALAQQVGYHGKLTGDCVTCHTEHRGADVDLRKLDPRQFNHGLAQFALNGSHRSLACEECHLQHSPTPGQMRYIGIKFASCVDCHANPHVDMPAADCQRCHTEQGWTGRALLFVHNRDSSFKLDAIHSALSCSSCHKQTGTVPTFRGTPASCSQCHTQTVDAMAGTIGSLVMTADPHNGRVSCIECHTTTVRSQAPEQFAAQCERCHGVQYRALFFNWQKALDEKEQLARTRLKQLERSDPQSQKQWNDLLQRAHATGMHNVQAAIKTFESIAR